MKLDYADLPLIEDKIVSIRNGYATVNDGVKHMKLHNFILPAHKCETIDHINLNRADNRHENLCSVNFQTQQLNCNIPSHNTSGHVGVSFLKRKNVWAASWRTESGVKQVKTFTCSKYGYNVAKEKAIEYHWHIENTLPHYVEALQGRTR